MSDDKVNAASVVIDLEHCSIISNNAEFSKKQIENKEWIYVGDSSFGRVFYGNIELKRSSRKFIQSKIDELTELLDEVDSL